MLEFKEKFVEGIWMLNFFVYYLKVKFNYFVMWFLMFRLCGLMFVNLEFEYKWNGFLIKEWLYF